MTRRRPDALLATLLVALAATSVHAARWTVAPDGAEVVFTSKAPLETFDGRTTRLEGWVSFDPDDLAAPVTGELAVHLASFDTGKGKRNKHMRENHLETDHYPTARFVPEAVTSPTAASLPPGAEVDVQLRGTLDLHGVARPLTCPVRLRRDASGAVSVRTHFTVSLEDHAIPRPQFLFMKLADEQQVEARCVLRPEASP